MKVVIEIKNGVVFGINSDEPIEVHIIDYDTEGLDKESLIKYAHEIIVPVECKGGCDITELLNEAKDLLISEANELL